MPSTLLPGARASRLALAFIATLLLAAALIAVPFAQPSRADAVLSVDTEAEYRAALTACEALEASELCVIEFTTDIEMTTTGGNPEYNGDSDLYLVGVGDQREIFTNTSDYLQFLYSGSAVEVIVDNLHIRSFQWNNAGGAIGKWTGNLTIVDSIFEENAGAGGGAVFYSTGSFGSLAVIDSVFTLNSAGSGTGGAIYASNALVYAEGSEFTYNATSGDGGAIGVENDSLAFVDETTFEENSATLGGAVHAADSSDIYASNSTFYSNNGGDGGGAVWAFEGDVSFDHVTAYDNVPGHVQIVDASGDFMTFGSVFQDLSDTFPTCSITGLGQSLGYNWAANDDCWADPMTGDVIDGVDAMLTELADNGGVTRTARPHYGSDLVNAIPEASCDIDGDQRGVVRPQGAGCDMGAVELEDPFPDVSVNHQFAEEVYWLAQTGISGGFDDGTFRPGAAVTRQAMAAFLYRFAGEPEFTAPGTATFPDVPTSHPFFEEVEWLADSGVTGGFDDGTFRPGATVTRQAMAAFLYRYANLIT
jgi:predicted outer membrane repeat protein